MLLAEKVFILRDVASMVQHACSLIINFSDQRAFEYIFKVDIFANQIRKVDVLIRWEIRASASIHELT